MDIKKHKTRPPSPFRGETQPFLRTSTDTVACGPASWFLSLAILTSLPLLFACGAFILSGSIQDFVRANALVRSSGFSFACVTLYAYSISLLLLYGADHRTSTPILVSGDSTISDVWPILHKRGLVPVHDHDHYFTISGRNRVLEPSATMISAGIKPMTHLNLRFRSSGGAHRSTPVPNSRSTSPDTPSKHTRSQTQDESMMTSAVLVSPIKRRRVIKSSSGTPDGYERDRTVWDDDDDAILARDMAKRPSEVYKHFKITLHRVKSADGSPYKLQYRFTCKYDPANHEIALVDRSGSKGPSSGTSNLRRQVEKCNKRRGVDPNSDSHANAQQTLFGTISRYNPARHRAIIALRCVTSHRPANSVNDPLYRREIELLRPSTSIPSASTVGSDIRKLYEEGSKSAREYFSKHDGSVHLVVDGWTAPIVASYLGIVAIWFDQGRIWRSTLEFIRLLERHTGDYLARVIAECLKRFGLDKKFHSICMDNASNCDKTATELPKHIPSFRGKVSRTRCFPHTVNLVAKAFLSFFSRPTRKAKTPKVAPSKRKLKSKTTVPVAVASASESLPPLPDDSDDSDSDSDIFQESSRQDDLVDQEIAADQDEQGDVDEGKAAFDEATISAVNKEAIAIAEEASIKLTADEKRAAANILPKVAGLARRVHDSSVLKEKFDRLVKAQDGLEGQQRSLTRRVATRWNSDLACIAAHVDFETPVKQLTSDKSNKLSAYALTDVEWNMARELVEVLEVFEEITRLFSQAEVPLIHEVLPMLEALEHDLVDIRDSPAVKFNVTRVAAIAALLVVAKYYALSDDNEIYRIGIVMSPDKKLKWFSENSDWREEDVRIVERVVKERWEESYKSMSSASMTRSSSNAQPSRKEKERTFATHYKRQTTSTSSYPTDSIEAYLSSDAVSTDVLNNIGGSLKYWEQAKATQPALSRMALDFLSAPASSVDAERAFSNGRLQVGHLQHGMSSQTFKARAALGSWYNSPFFSEDLATEIISKASSRKGKEKAIQID